MRRLICLLLACLALPVKAAPDLVLGVFASGPVERLQERYDGLAAYLSEALGDTQVRLLVLTQAELDEHIALNAVDLLLTNPSHYSIIRHHNALTGALATQVVQYQGESTQAMGGVILVPADSIIESLSDLSGKRIAIPGEHFLAGYQAPVYELMQAGVALPQKAQLMVAGHHVGVIDALLAGEVEVGFVRTGVLESFTDQGLIPPNSLRVINQQRLPGYPFAVSTRLYPEWPFFALPHVDQQQIRKIVAALLALEPDHPAAVQAGIAGFVPPSDYLAVERLARTLRVPPFDALPEFTLLDAWHKYRNWLSALALLLLLFALAMLGLVMQNRRVRNSQQDLRLQRKRLQEVIRGTDIGTWEWDMRTDRLVINPRWASMLGRDPLALDPLAMQGWVALVHPEDRARFRQAMDEHVLGAADAFSCEYRLRHASGEWVWVSSSGRIAERDSLDQPLRMSGTQQDVSARYLAERQLKLAASAFTHASEGIMITDSEGLVIDVNEAFSRITGFSRAEALGQLPLFLRSDQDDEPVHQELMRALRETGEWQGEVWNRRKDGERFAEKVNISSVYDERGQRLHYIALFSDITASKLHQQELESIAHYDRLTGLPNRELLVDRMQLAMQLARQQGRLLAVACLDLDGFKLINDRHGHEVGDHLLVELAARMRQIMRPEDTLARLGGDEFILVLTGLDQVSDCLPILDNLLSLVARPVIMDILMPALTASVGVSLFSPGDDMDADQLLRYADQAMINAKQGGRNRYELFDHVQEHALQERQRALQDIRQALTEEQFCLFYQPKVNMRTGGLVGVEALIRWQHPELGMRSPAEFLPVIEGQRLGLELGEWVMHTALSQFHAWRAAGVHVPVSVNVAADQLLQADFIERLDSLLNNFPVLPAGALELEILESSALDDMQHVGQVIDACHARGIMLSLDDFGTGYSSLTYLRRLPVDVLKIDQSFVRDMLDDPDDLAIVASIMGLARSFSRPVIAEGVETVEHGELLLLLGCEQAQGYGIARPMPADQVAAWIAGWQPASQWRTFFPRLLDARAQSLLFAEVELRGWLKSVEQFVSGKSPVRPQLDAAASRFGSWYLAYAEKYFRQHPALKPMKALHADIYQQAATLVALADAGQWQGAEAGLAGVSALSDTLLSRLRELLEDVATGVRDAQA